jgi:hypothetical protein
MQRPWLLAKGNGLILKWVILECTINHKQNVILALMALTQFASSGPTPPKGPRAQGPKLKGGKLTHDMIQLPW